MNSNKCENKRRYVLRLIFAVCISAILISLCAGIVTSSAASTEPKLDIAASNLEYAEQLRLYHAVTAEGLDADQRAQVRMLVWYTPKDEYLLTSSPDAVLEPDVPSYTITVKGKTLEDCILFRTDEITPKNMVDSFYYRACITVDGEEYYSEVSKYSIIDYMYARYDDIEEALDDGADAAATERLNKQKKLYDTLRSFAANQQIAKGYRTDRLANSDFILVELVGASFADGFKSELMPKGGSATVIPERNGDFGYVIVAPDGSVVGNGKDFTLGADATAGIYNVYTDLTSVSVVGATVGGEVVTNRLYNAGQVLKLKADAATADDYEVFYWNIDGKPVYADPTQEFEYTVGTSHDTLVCEAVYATEAPAAGFGDLVSLDLSGNNSGGQSFSFSAVKGWSLAADPMDALNSALRLNKTYDMSGTSILATAMGSGANTVVEFDLYIDKAVGSDIVLQLDIDSAYRVEVRCGYDGIYFVDYNNSTGYINDFGSTAKLGKWNKIRIEYYPVSSSGGAVTMNSVFYFNGRAVSASSSLYKTAVLQPGDFRLWAMSDVNAELYVDNLKYYRTDNTRLDEAMKTAIVHSVPTQEEHWLERLDRVARIYGDEVARAVGDLTSNLFTEEMYEWLAGLYDPKSGGFYYSNSARDNYGYLADVESTGQSGSVLGTFGGSLNNVLNAEQKALLASWAQLCQSNEDGYFYHPQWGTDIGAGRRSRDLGNYGSRITAFGSSDFLFDHANYRLSGGSTGYKGSAQQINYEVPTSALTESLYTRSTAVLVSRVVMAADTSSMPAQFASEEAFREYLDGLWENNKSIGKSYSIGHNITSQNSQILAAGLERVAISWLNERQEAAQQILREEGRELTGLWEAGGVYELDDPSLGSYYKKSMFLKDVDGDGVNEAVVPDVNYTFVSGLLKISGCYNSLGFEMPYAKEALNSAIKLMCASADEYIALGESIVSVYNPPNAANNIMNNITKYGDPTVRTEAKEMLKENAYGILINTEKKIAVYRKEDGSFSYSPKNSSSHSQGEPAAVPGSNEGDVNGTALALGARSSTLTALGITGVGIFPTHAVDINGDGVVGENETHLNRFIELLNSTKVKAKHDDSSLDGKYTFDENSTPVENSANDSNSHVVEIRDGHLYMKDNESKLGLTVYFDAAKSIDEEPWFYFNSDLKFDKGASGYPIQLYIGPMKLQFIVSGSNLEFQGRHTSDKHQEHAKTFGTLKAMEWFNLDVAVFPEGIDVDGTTYYCRVTVTQNGKTYQEYYKDFAAEGIDPSSYTQARIYSLQGATPGLYINNVTAISYGGVSGSGDYNFDINRVQSNPEAFGISGGVIVDDGDEKTENNKYLAFGSTLEDSEVTLQAGSTEGDHNFLELQINMIFADGKNSNGALALTDTSGKVITVLNYQLTVNENGTDGVLKIFHGKSGQMLLELDISLDTYVTIRTEYHYGKQRLDLVARYRSSVGNRYMDATGAVLNGMPVHDSGANAADCADLTVISSAELIYIDDVYIRNVAK